MNFKTTAVLIILLAVLGCFVYFMKDKAPSYSQMETDRLAVGQGQPVFTIDDIKTADVNQITFTQDGKTAKLVKQDNTWHEVDPVDFPLAPQSVDQLIDAVAGLKYTDRFTPGKNKYPDAAKLGLSPARASITLTISITEPATTQPDSKTTTGKSTADTTSTHRVNVGRTIAGGKIYVSLDDKPEVYVVNDDLSVQLADKPVQRWRSKTLPGPRMSQTDQLTLTLALQGQPAMTAVAVKLQGQWQLDQPDQDRANKDIIASLLTSLSSATIEKFVVDDPENLVTYGLASPRLTLSVVSSKPAVGPRDQQTIQSITQTLRIGAPTDLQSTHYYATWSRGQNKGGPAVFTLPDSTLKQLARTTNDLRDPSLTPLKQSQVKEMTITQGDQHLVFIQSARGWEFAKAQKPAVKFAADDGAVSNVVASIINARANTFELTSKKSKTEPMATVTFTGLGKQPDVLRIWPNGLATPKPVTTGADQSAVKKNNPTLQWLVIRNDEPVGRVVDAKALPGMISQAWTFRDRELANLNVDQINHIQVTQSDGHVVELSRTLPVKISSNAATQPVKDKSAVSSVTPDTAGPWQLKDASGHLNTSLPEVIADGVSPLQANTWRKPGSALGKAVTKLVVTTQDGKIIELTMDDQGNALFKGVDQVFEVAPALREAILGNFENRTVLGLSHSQISQVTREIGHDLVTLRLNEQGKYEAVALPPAPAAKLPVDQNAATALFDTLVGLRASKSIPVPKMLTTQLALRFIIKDKAGKAHTLTLHKHGDQYLAQTDDGKWLAIPAPEATSQKLTASLLVAGK